MCFMHCKVKNLCDTNLCDCHLTIFHNTLVIRTVLHPSVHVLRALNAKSLLTPTIRVSLMAISSSPCFSCPSSSARLLGKNLLNSHRKIRYRILIYELIQANNRACIGAITAVVNEFNRYMYDIVE